MHTRTSLLALLIILLALALPVSPPPRATAEDTCTFTPHFNATPLYAAPLADPAQQRGEVPGGVPLLALKRSGLTYDALIYVTLDTTSGGWVDQRSGTLTGACDDLPLDNTPLIDYPTICTAAVSQAVPFFDDAQLFTPKPFDLQPGTYVVTRRSAASVFVRLDHAMGGWTALSAITLGPACSTVMQAAPFQAVALDNARLWTQPNVQTGARLLDLPSGTGVVILAGPVEGPIRYDTADVGDWYQVAYNGQSGWVWSARLDFNAAPPPVTPPSTPSASPTARDNARLWSQPNVQAGQVIGFLTPGTALQLLSGPVEGPIRYDTTDTGDWYYVQAEGSLYAGWLWAGRIAFE